MGKDWYWGSGAAKSYKRSRGRARNRDTISFSGCMSAVFQFFDFHHFQYCLHQPSSENNSSIVLKGMEAPRNSLELELELESEEAKVEEVEKLHIPILMGMQIKTRASNDLSSEISCSPAPGTKTPTLVARLMGLDLLPSDSCSSPSSSIHASATPPSINNKSHLHRLISQRNISGTCSLPETPRASSSSSRRSVDSLQINKDNISEVLEFKSLRRKEKNKYQDENRISARQIAKQMKESVISRRVGLVDITNSSPSRRSRDEELLVKSKKSPKALENSSLESNNNKSILSTPADSQEKQKQVVIKKPPQTSDIIRKSKQQETSMKASTNIHVIPDHNKCNKTPSFNPSQTVLLQSQRKQSHVCDGDGDGAQESRGCSGLSSCAGHKYMQATHTHNYKPSSDSEDSTNKATCAQHEYLTTILKRSGICKDPSIFHQLELTDTTCSSTVKDRKLLFHVVDEMLVGIGHMQGSELVDTLCAKIRSFPGKNCRALEDIDGIAEEELSRWWFEEEGESIVGEIDTGVLDTLLHEMASMLFRFQVHSAHKC